MTAQTADLSLRRESNEPITLVMLLYKVVLAQWKMWPYAVKFNRSLNLSKEKQKRNEISYSFLMNIDIVLTQFDNREKFTVS